MNATGFLRNVYLRFWSQPTTDRTIYRSVRIGQIRSILELGVGTGQRAQRLIGLWQCGNLTGELRYTGIDLFEARPAETPGIKLKQAHQLLATDRVRVQLTPGDPYLALARIANSCRGNDLVIIAGDQDQESLERAWMYLPRMIHDQTQVFRQRSSDQDGTFERLAISDIHQLAQCATRSLRRAA